jgi:hypothetical protein
MRPDLDFWRVVNALTILKAKKPYLRVGQILVNASGETDPFYISDERLADALESLLVPKSDPP